MDALFNPSLQGDGPYQSRSGGRAGETLKEAAVRVLVTGGTGYVGFCTVAGLLG
jgi:hypothetical protein